MKKFSLFLWVVLKTIFIRNQLKPILYQCSVLRLWDIEMLVIFCRPAVAAFAVTNECRLLDHLLLPLSELPQFRQPIVLSTWDGDC